MYEIIRIKHFSIEMIPLKIFAKINIKHFSNHLSGLKRFAKRNIKHVMSHSISRTMEWLIACFIFFFAKRLRALKWLEKCFILILTKLSKKSLSQANCFIFYTLGYQVYAILVSACIQAMWPISVTSWESRFIVHGQVMNWKFQDSQFFVGKYNSVWNIRFIQYGCYVNE